ncbi:AmmeMemoRadiSam system radical SAM enzyme [Candidatus Woesearchaeota archaeon]|nr:AmmeMemoRadiSam system radical SAM enzyme [Candidatus Woesearchaeota archaeon]
MKKALYWRKLKDSTVQCQLCPRLCTIKNNEIGNCRTRKNENGILYSRVYGKAVSSYIDPIEKKPLFHFFPGKTAFSIGTAGCNLHCKSCQNWSISQANPSDLQSIELSPESIVAQAEKNNCKSIAYTYTEPNVFYEYVLDTARLARKKKIKNIIVTNAFANLEPIKELYPYIDAVNIDFKAFDDEFYRNICDGKLEPVLDAIKQIKKVGAWIEITNLIIPTLNDSMEKIKEMCIWIKETLGKDTPLHFSRFFPDYLLRALSPTSAETLDNAYETAKQAGLNHVYIGNVVSDKESTFCPRCGKLLIKRFGFQILENNIKKGKCSCMEHIAGIWE